MLAYDARKIFELAEQFHRASSILLSAFDQKNIQVIPPSFTCIAFSLELYLKSLITLEKGGYTKGNHNLEKFIEMLNPDTKDKLRLYAIAIAEPQIKQFQDFAKAKGLPPLPDFDFDAALTASKNAFVNWRYVYEENFKENEGWQASEIILAVRKIILELHPEWAT